MPEIVYYVAASIDGFIATADGGVEWLSEFEGGDDFGYKEFYSRIDGILMGRKTYEQVLTFGDWPYPGVPTWVFSRRTLPTPANEITVTTHSPGEVTARLADSGVARAWLVGGGELAGSLAREGLVTEYVVSVMPVLLGDGVRLLGRRGEVGRLRLESSTRLGDVVQNVYRPAR